jgi:hypothetical protein
MTSSPHEQALEQELQATRTQANEASRQARRYKWISALGSAGGLIVGGASALLSVSVKGGEGGGGSSSALGRPTYYDLAAIEPPDSTPLLIPGSVDGPPTNTSPAGAVLHCSDGSMRLATYFPQCKQPQDSLVADMNGYVFYSSPVDAGGPPPLSVKFARVNGAPDDCHPFEFPLAMRPASVTRWVSKLTIADNAKQGLPDAGVPPYETVLKCIQRYNYVVTFDETHP